MKSTISPIDKKNVNFELEELFPAWFYVIAIIIFICRLSSGFMNAISSTFMISSVLLLGNAVFK